jgi:hypothetical protein
LIPVLAVRLATPSLLVDLRLPGLGNIAVGNVGVRPGAAFKRTQALRRINTPHCSTRFQRFESAFLQRQVMSKPGAAWLRRLFMSQFGTQKAREHMLEGLKKAGFH